ncbi:MULTISPECIES: hypothetical protein [Stenotrophomonas]|uniref:hypothetical protein n=1 Tax=Stenotrophomonas TaxID=40323 RepID=UPI0021C6F704|nr:MULTISPECIES: hypothetical protein [Stenotrophomonas]MCU1136886.1 hypothetical protein [Stenotrophomonas maltophilia]MEC4339789.1 hypothetical protein [Stenotrophomonas pavanii]
MAHTFIAAKFEVCCPHCSKALLQVTPSSCTAVGQQYWLRDGDEVPGVLCNLPPAHEALALSTMLSTGQCWSCFDYYYAVECTFMPGVTDEILIDWMAGVIKEIDNPRHLACKTDEASNPWLLTVIRTEVGMVMEHTLGPFKLERLGDVSGPHGVSACGPNSSNKPWLDARDLVLQQFETLQQFNHQAVAA